MERKSLIYLLLVVILGAIIRFGALTWNPASLNWDEVSHGYNAYSILKTGMDQWGQKFPVFNFRAYGDYPTTLNLYLTIPFLILFGLTEFAIRFPHALLGTLTIVSAYFLTFGITNKKNVSLLTSFLVAISPWYVFTSRFVLQSNLSVFLLITSAALFVNRDRNRYFFPISFFLFTLTLFSYHTTRIFSPLFIVGVLLIYKDEIKNKLIYLFFGLFVILSAYILINPGALARGNVLFLIDQSSVNQIESARNVSKLPSVITKLIYNRPVYFALKFSKNYINYFSPKFLFLNGGTQYQFSIPNRGLIYPVSLPFFYIGLVLLIVRTFKKSDEESFKKYKLLLLWLILSPIPASLTNESYTVLRATTMLPIPEILIAISLYWFVDMIPTKVRSVTYIIYIMLVFVFAESYFVNYFTKYRTDYSWSWQYGYKEVIDYVKDNYDRYDKIVVTKKYAEPHEYFLFYLKYDPTKYLNDSTKIAFNQSNWFWVDKFDKFYFVNDWQVKLNRPEISSIQNYFVTESKLEIDCTNKKCILVTSPDNFPPGWIKLKTINFLDGKPAFEIYANN
jgi:4-amino-4-deoxy-L-arabinose transferase-like glycosyltransferase